MERALLRIFCGLLLMLSLSAVRWAQGEVSNSSPAQTESSARARVPADDPILSVAGEVITAQEFERMIAVLPLPQQRELASPAARRSFANQLIRLLALAKSAEDEKLDRDATLAARLRLLRMQLLAAAGEQSILRRTEITADEIQKYYQQNPSLFVELHLLHISVPVASLPVDPDPNEKIRKEMEALAQRAARGEDFIKLARQYSKDSDAAQGGDLGFIGRGHFGEALDNAVFRLKPDEVSPVIEAPGGLHIFKVLAHRRQPLNEAREAVVEILKNQRLQAMLPSLIREMQPLVNEAYFTSGGGAPTTNMPVTVTIEKDGKPVKDAVTVTTKPPEVKTP